MRLSVKKWHEHGFGAPRKFLSSIASWLVVAPLISLIAVTSTATTANAVSANPTPVCSGATCTVTFSYTGDYYAWSAPTSGTYTIKVWGGQGGTSNGTGQGGYATGAILLSAGEQIFVYVGGQGTYPTSGSGSGGYNGGGAGASSGERQGGGGGASDVRRGGNALANRIIVAGGGGGSEESSSGGTGGGLTGFGGTPHPSYNGSPGQGGSQTAGGCSWGTNSGYNNQGCGSLGFGGTGGVSYGAGGGGGYYGGGGGVYDSGGGGGSSYIGGVTSGSTIAGNSTMPNPAGGTMTGNTGAGRAVITYQNGATVTSFSSAIATPSNLTTFNYSLVMTQSVSEVESSDFENSGTASGCSFSTNSSSGSNFTISIANCSEGTLIPNLRASTFVETSTSLRVPSSSFTSTTSITIDRTAPVAPSAPDLATASDLGTSSTDNITTTGTRIFTGTAETGTTVQLYVDGVASGATCTATSGNYSCTSASLTLGTKSVTAVATDAAGNISSISTALPVVIADIPGAPTSVSSALGGNCTTSATVMTGIITTQVNSECVVSFTNVGSTTWTVPSGVTSVQALVVGGGGSGGRSTNVGGAGGGGAGGVVTHSSFAVSGTVAVTVGAGGGSQTSFKRGNNGGQSNFSTLIAPGGGGGGLWCDSGCQDTDTTYESGTGKTVYGIPGGSGGGSGAGNEVSYGGAVTTPTLPAGATYYGNVGGDAVIGNTYNGTGGGGAGGPSAARTTAADGATAGGPGISSSITGTSTFYAAGGGGSGGNGTDGAAGGSGIGGSGSKGAGYLTPTATDGSVNTGSGGGGAQGNDGSKASGSGGSGIVIIRYTPSTSNSASVTFTAPVSNGGTAVTGYEVVATPTSGSTITVTGTSSPISVSGLTGGITYTFTIRTRNAIGFSSPATNAGSLLPIIAPGAPTIGTATATGATSATVTFSAPTSNGGSTITNYTATSSPGGITGTLSQAGSGTITINGLSPNTSYTFSITATNASGTSTASASSNSITTATPATLTYNGNGETSGNVPIDSSTYNVGQNATVLGNTGGLIRNGYSFAGWTGNLAGTGTVYNSGSSYTLPSANSILYAKWTGNSNSVSFDAQGGVSSTSTSWVTGSSLALPAAPTRAGYSFSGWYDAATGGTRVGSASASYTPTNTAGFTLYAQWSANSNTVTFNTQGGSPVAPQPWTTATSLTLPSAPTRAGYTFNGWYTAETGGTKVGSGASARNGLHFDGNGQIVVPHSNTFNFTNTVTIEAWINTTSTSEQYITTKGESSFYLATNISGGIGKVSFWLNGVSNGSGNWLHSAATVNDGNWHHIAGTYDGTTLKIYVDGELSASRTVSATIQTGASSIYIGSRGGGALFNGKMYDIRFWNIARGAAEISASMNAQLTGSESGLVAAYSLNQGSAGGTNTGVTTATSSTGTNDGTLSGFALTGATSNWIEAASGSSTYNPTNTAGFTLYAQWSANTNLVSFDTLGGSSVASSSFQTGGSLTLPANPTLVGSTFVGWFLAPTGGSALTSPYSPTATSALTIYARWNTNRTLAINSGSYLAGYARTGTPPTLTATPSAGVGTGTITFTSATTSVCTVNSTSGLVAFVNTGTCTISAAITEAVGFTSATAPSISFAVRSTPGAPTGLSATPGNGQVTISWTAPTTTGGGITSYTVTATPTGATCTWSSGPLSCVITGLTNGTSYSFVAQASNSQGSSGNSTAVSATPRTVPNAPAITSVQAQSLVNGINVETYYCSAYGASPPRPCVTNSLSTTTASQIDFQWGNGVVMGTSYGDRVEVKFSGYIMSPTTKTVTFLSDGDDGDYLDFNGVNIISNWIDKGVGSKRSASVTLQANVYYPFTYWYYENGGGAWTRLYWNESGSDVIVPAANFYREDGQANTGGVLVSFTPPVTTGGTTITGYTVTASNGTSVSGPSSPLRITGLKLGVPYTFTVTATNAAGTSVASAPSTSITLRGSPGTPTAPNASLSVGGVSLVWAAPNANGGTISDYTIEYSNNGGSTWTPYVDEVTPTTATTVRGLTTGVTYIFRVAAITEQGTGAFSPASTSVTPAAAPDTPAKPTGSANGTSITITWVAPNTNGATISSYNVSYSSDSGNTWTSVAPASTTSATVANLTVALTYIFRVQAVNARGSSGYSEPSDPIAIGTAPLAPTALVAEIDATTSTSAVLKWKKPVGGAGIVEAKTTVDSSSFIPGLLGKRYNGYYSDNVDFFNTAPLFSGTGTPVNSTSIFNFSSYADLYSWMWTGYFKAPMTGVYRFYLSSDDASHLWIGDTATSGFTTSNATVNNGGLHPTLTKTGSISLVANQFYPIRVMFGELYGGDIVSLFWDLPNFTRVTNGTGYFFQNPTGAVTGAVKGCATTVGNSGGVQISKEGNNCVVKFTNPGVNTWTVPDGITSADVLVVGGGGGAGFDAAGGGGGGAVIERLAQSVTPGAKFNVNVGNGGATSQSVGGQAQDGGSSTFGTITAVGGGGGGSKNANGRGVIGAGGGGGGHANPGSGGNITLGGTPSSGADSFWGWSATNTSMVNNQGSVAQFSYIQASLSRTVPLNVNVTSNVTFKVNVDNSISNIIGWVGERIDTYSIKVELLNSSGVVIAQNSFSGTTKHTLVERQVSVSYAGAVASVRLTITGFDAGYWAGFYGPIFRNPSLLVNGAAFPPTTLTVSGFGGGGASGSRAVGNGGGGGGAGGIGGGSATSAGGIGVLSNLTGTYFGGGGAGGSWNSTGGVGGLGGGGNGGNGSGSVCGNDGAPNTGGGGGAMGNAYCSNRTLGAGGSGVVILRYAAANTNIELPPPSDYVIQYAEASSETSPIVSTGLALHFDANSYSGSGTTVTDLSGNGRNGTMSGSVLPTFTSSSPKSFNFQASGGTAGNKISVTNKFLPDDLTIQVWMKSTGAGSGLYHFQTMGIVHAENGGGANDWGFGINSAGKLAFGVGPNDVTIATDESVNTGQWINVAVTRVKSTGEIKLYINGVLKKTGTGNSGNSLNAAGDTWIGNAQDGGPPFVGNISQVLAYNSKLSDANILANYNAGCALFSLCANALSWQTFNDGVSSAESATVTNLVPGKNYIFRVASKNGVGPSSYTSASNMISVRGAPVTAPTISTVTAGNQRAVVAFTAPTNIGGSPIIRYTATATAAGTPTLTPRTCIWTSGALTCTINELTNGREYTVTLTATNSFGTSVASTGVAVTPKTTPDAPTAITAVGTATQLALTWTAPVKDGGSSITGYKIEISTNLTEWTETVPNTGSAATAATLTGLTNGLLYNIRITAINAVGAGLVSEIATGTPKGAPAAPAAPTGNGSNASAFIKWVAPANNGAPITDYEISFGTSAAGPWTTFSDTVTSATAVTVTDLTNGTGYYFRIRAVNSIGTGEWSVASSAITPATIPGAPNLTAVNIPTPNEPGSLALTFIAGDTGGAAITGYEFSINAGATWSALVGTSSLKVTGLTNGITYGIRIRAVNSQGVGPASNERSGTPTAPPDAPVISGVVADNQKLTIAFSAPAKDGGSAISGYKYQIQESGTWSISRTVTGLPLVIDGLVNDQEYLVRILASNSGGDGAWSSEVSGKPFTTPAAPSISSITSGNGSLSVAYTVSNNGSAITATEYSLDAGASWIRSASITSPLVINGLSNGTSYTPQIRFINAAGVGGATSWTGTPKIPFTTPFAPAITSVNSTATSISLSFSINNGGNAVTHVAYRLRSVSAAGITNCSVSYSALPWGNTWSTWTELLVTSSITIDNLLSSNCYDVQIRARNDAGYGGSSREAGKPVSVPSAPEIISITAAAGSLGVAFNESADNGGAAITAYEYRIGSGSWLPLGSTQGFTLGASTFFNLGSLTNGLSYSITLRAVNSAGASAASASVSATPVTIPGAPVVTGIEPLDGALRVTFTAPLSNGGTPILGYQYLVQISGAPAASWVAIPSSAGITSVTINGLTNGDLYSVKIRAVNARGEGSESDPLTSVAPGKAPEAPTISTGIIGNEQVALVITPGLNGGYPLYNYDYSIDGGDWVTLLGSGQPLANPIVVTGLTNGRPYSFRVRAVNQRGESLPSAAITRTPATTPTSPTIVSTSTNDGSLSIAFEAPASNGGSTITAYDYSVNGGTTWTRRASGGINSPLVISGLTNGVAYNIKIRAVNGIGNGAGSATQIGIPQIPGAGRPISLITTPLDGSVRIAWAPPTAYVGAPIVGYRVNATPGNGECTWSTGEYNCTILGLTNGTSYTFTVTSLRNDNGTIRDIDTSVSSAVTTPRTLAGAPTSVTAVGGGNEATLSWSAPTNNGGANINDYLIEFSSDDGATWSAYSDAINAETTATVSGLQPGTQYRFRVAAVNGAGSSAFSSASLAAKTFEKSPELTLTLDQQSADGFAFIMSFKDPKTGLSDPVSFSFAATTNNPSATVEQVGDFFTVRGLAPGASVTVTVTANRSDYLQAVATIFSSALLGAPAPIVSSATALDGAFRITVDGYTANSAAGTSYVVTATAGAVIDDGAGVYRIVGLANGESAIATVTSSRPGYVTRTTSISGSALFLGVPAQIEGITGTRDGFTFTIANYAPDATYDISYVTSGNSSAIITQNAEVVTVKGLTNLEVATLTIKTERTGYMDASTEVIGVALPKSEVNTLSAISLSSGAIVFSPSTYEYSLDVANSISTYRVTPTTTDVDSTIAISINGGNFTTIDSGVQSALLNLTVGVNTITIAVTSQVGSVQNYLLYINRAKSNLSTLSAASFSVGGAVTSFDSNLNSYELTVPYINSSITATVAPTNSSATMRIKINSDTFTSISSNVASTALNLNVGNNLVTVEVTSEDGLSVTNYEFTVTRAGAEASQLGALAISVGTIATFSPDTLNYEVIVPNGTTSARVTPTLGANVTGSITVNGTELADGATSSPISLIAGSSNQITIVVTASDGSSTPYVINVKVDAPPTALALTRQSVGTKSNVAFTTQPQVAITDASGNRVLLNTSTVSVAITSGAGGQLIGTTTANAVRGLATFTNLGLRGVAGRTYTLTYSIESLNQVTQVTQQITLTAGEVDALVVRAGSSSAASGVFFATPLEVAAVDSDQNVVATFGSAISISVSGGGQLSGATVRTPVAGVATFTDLALRGVAGSSYVITASSGSLSVTRQVALTFGLASALAITRASAGPVSGVAFTTQPQISIRDSAGNVVTTATGEVTVSISAGVGGTISGTTTAPIVNGVATFTNLAISGVAGTAYTLSYSAATISSTSEILTVTAGAPTRVQLFTPAAGFNNGTAFTTAQPVLRIQDATGNLVTTSSASVTVTVSTGGVLLGTTSLNASSGIATFTNLGVFGQPGMTYTLTFASPGLISATQTILLTSGSSLVPVFATSTSTIDGFTAQITNFSRIFNWTFAILEGPESAQISLGATGLLTVTGMPVGTSATISATTARTGFENGAATVTGSTLLAPLRPTFSAVTQLATGFRAQVTNFDASYTWKISASNGGTATISSTGLITISDLSTGVSSDVTVTTSRTGRVSASATFSGTAIGAEVTTTSQDLSASLLTSISVYPLCAGGSSPNEGVTNLNDRNSKSKYLCFNASSRLNATYIRNSAGFYTGDIGTKIITGIQFTSGDSDRGRDPIIYTLFGCTGLNTGCSPIVVNGRTGIDVLRNTASAVQSFLNSTPYNYYKVTFGALRTSWTDAAQVAEVSLIGIDANAAGLVPTFGAVTRIANGFTVPITNFNSAYSWQASVTNNGGVAIGLDGVVTVTGIAGGSTATVSVTTSRPKYNTGIYSVDGEALNAALIPTFGVATPTADGFTVPISNYSANYTWSASISTGAATISGGVLTVSGQSGTDQLAATVTTTRAGYATGTAQVVSTALATGLTPTFGPSVSRADGFTIQVTNFASNYTWSATSSAGTTTISATGLISVTGLNPGVSATVSVTTTKTGAFTVLAQTTGKALIGSALTPRFALSVSTTNGFTAQIINHDSSYTWSGTAGAGETVQISESGLVTVTGVTTGRLATATITATKTGFVTGSNTISGTAVPPAVQTVGGSDIQLQVPVSASTSTTEVIVTIDIPVDAAPGSTTFTGSAVATDAVDQGLRTVKIEGSNTSGSVTDVSTPIAITIPASAGIGIPVYSPDGSIWVELPLLAGPALPDGQAMGFYRYDDGTILILTRKIGE